MATSFEVVENTFNAHQRCPLSKIDTSKKVIDIVLSRTTAHLPILPAISSLHNPQGILKDFEEWADLYLEMSEEGFMYSPDDHYVTLERTKGFHMGAALVVLNIQGEALNRQLKEPWHWFSKFTIGAIPHKASYLVDLYEEGKIHAGRLVEFKSMHKGKFISPKVVFPYGNNSFDLNLGHIEEVQDTEASSPTIEEDYVLLMDDL